MADIVTLIGPPHGGSPIRYAYMFPHLKETIKDWTLIDEVETSSNQMLGKG